MSTTTRTNMTIQSRPPTFVNRGSMNDTKAIAPNATLTAATDREFVSSSILSAISSQESRSRPSAVLAGFLVCLYLGQLRQQLYTFSLSYFHEVIVGGRERNMFA